MTLESEKIKRLNLEDEVVFTPKTAAGARSRYVYFPDHVVAMPGPGDGISTLYRKMVNESAFDGLASAVFGEFFRPTRPPDVEDESVGSFISRRADPRLADNLVSALLHGIYAGDLYQLSMKSLFPDTWDREAMYGSLFGAFMQLGPNVVNMSTADYLLLQELSSVYSSPAQKAPWEQSSQYSFRKGIGTLTQALADAVRGSGIVRIKTDTAVQRLEYDGSRNVMNVSHYASRRSRRLYFGPICSRLVGRVTVTIDSL